MRLQSILFFCLLLGFTACQKPDDQPGIAQQSTETLTDRSGGNGGGNNNPGFLLSTFPNDAKLIGGNPSSLLINFSQAAPVGGWTLTLSTSDAALQVPATYFVAQGLTQVQVAVTSSAITNAKVITYTVKLGTQTKSNTLKLFPATATFPPPLLSKPGNGSKFNFALNILFDWNDNNNAWYYDFQVSHSPNFDSLWFEIGFPDSFYTTNYFASNKTHYWRVRSIDASGNPGPWSEVRNFFIKPQ